MKCRASSFFDVPLNTRKPQYIFSFINANYKIINNGRNNGLANPAIIIIIIIIIIIMMISQTLLFGCIPSTSINYNLFLRDSREMTEWM